MNWLDMMEFTINASVSEITKFAPFELNGGYMSSMLQEIRSDTVIPKAIKEFVVQVL